MSLPKYELFEKEDTFHDDHWSVRILDGDYEGLEYQYDIVKILESEAEQGEAVLEFNTITLSNPNDCDLTDEKDKGIMGAVLVDIITENLKREVYENGTPDSEESVD